MQLKEYQKAALKTLRLYFEKAQLHGPAKAYEEIVSEPEQASRLGKYVGKYAPKEGLPEVPYVCLRLPTGGGKTILAAHSIAVAKEAWLERDFPLVLWLVPSTTIRKQTVEALKKSGHAYRKVLDEAFDGRVRVFDIADFTQLRPHDLRSNLCVVVGTIQTLRVKDTEGRKVYAHHEELEPYFSSVPSNASGPEKRESGDGSEASIKFSFANLLHIERPLMIVDEAHNAVTGLTEEMQQRVNPAAIIEFTATPQKAANTIHSATAQELKAEEMIKLPIRLFEEKTWEQAVTNAIITRQLLEEEARKDTDYLRPLILFQAQAKDREVTVERLRTHLVEVQNIPPDQIAVATGDQRELDAIDLFDPACPVRFIITVEALKEGWDCSFAYVFCSVANVKSATAAEQLLGRVMRMPYAAARKSAVLNKAYAHVVSDQFGKAALEMVETLEGMGFSEEDAKGAIEEATQTEIEGEGMFSVRAGGPQKTVLLEVNASLLSAASAISQGKIEVRATADGRAAITFKGVPSRNAIEEIQAALPESAGKSFREEVADYIQEAKKAATPAERGEPFRVGRLGATIQGEFVWADTDVFLEFYDWSLADHPAEFSETEFNIQKTGEAFEIDLNGEKIEYRPIASQRDFVLRGGVANWTREQLVRNLDRLVRDASISQPDLIAWLSSAVGYLLERRRIPLAALMECKYILARRIKERLERIKRQVREGAYQRGLFEPEAAPSVSFENSFEFRDGIFWDAPKQPLGRYVFAKHFTGPANIGRLDAKKPEGEEFQCAFAIDTLEEIDFWLRNVANHPDAFRLPVVTGWTYPDFVAKLKDGRILVVEYKGEGYLNEKAHAAAAIGALWEQKSDGKGLNLMAEKKKNGLDVREQLLEKIRNC